MCGCERLGKLFCDLAGTSTAAAKKASARKAAAVGAAKLLSRRAAKGATIIQAKETLYAPRTAGPGQAGMTTSGPLQTSEECQVIHLILGPLHLDLRYAGTSQTTPRGGSVSSAEKG
jgi:hypothetical protein